MGPGIQHTSRCMRVTASSRWTVFPRMPRRRDKEGLMWEISEKKIRNQQILVQNTFRFKDIYFRPLDFISKDSMLLFFGYESTHQCNLVPSCSHNYWCSLRRDLDKWWLFFMRTFFSFIANLSVAGIILSHPWQGMLSLCRDLTQSRSSFLLRVRGPPYLGIEGPCCRWLFDVDVGPHHQFGSWHVVYVEATTFREQGQFTEILMAEIFGVETSFGLVVCKCWRLNIA